MGVNPSNARPFWGNGHYYVFTQEKATWHDALSRSNVNLGQLGTNGYLATVTSADEHNFIFNYSFNGGKIPNPGFLGGSDNEKEGTWTWRAGPEQGQVFRSNGTNQIYTNWGSGEPNNKKNEDFLQILTSGYWNDTDPDSTNGYVTEWGRSGAEFTAGFADLNTSGTANGYENGTAPKMTINFDRFVPNDYVDIRNNTPLIDIPITFGGTAVLNTDYTVSVSGGGSYLSGGRLYVRNTSSVVLTFKPINNSSWQAPRTITASLQGDDSETIYAISGNASSQVWLFDDEPQLSLGQGAYQFIRTTYTDNKKYNLPYDNKDFNTNADVLLFDNEGIDKVDANFNSLGLYDKFAIRWETYIRIPETGIYNFEITTDNGRKLTIRNNNINGKVVSDMEWWRTDAPGSFNSTGDRNLKKGDVLWVRLDYFEDTGNASAKLSWDRPNGSGGTVSNEVIPASAMFLSESLARGLNRTESDNDSTSLGFQLFANKSTSAPISVQLSSSSEPSNSTSNTALGQRQTGSTRVGDDYAFVENNLTIGSSSIGVNGNNGTYSWQPNQAFGTLQNVKSFDVKVLTDSYAENTESITLTLANGTGYGVSSNSQTISIADNPFVLTVEAGQNPIEAGGNETDLGWFTIKSNKVAPDGGLRVRYQITGGSATRNVDYYAPQATLSTTNFLAEDLVVLPTGAKEARVYISAIADAIREGNETVNLKLVANVETDDQGFTYQRYNVDSAKSAATLTITDSTAYAPAVVVTPADRTGLATVRAQLVSGKQQATFDVHLNSQPLADVFVKLSTSSGTLSGNKLTFTSSNWTQPQRVTLTDLRTDVASTVSLATDSSDNYYKALTTSQRVIPSSWPSELELTLWEGGGFVPVQPAASVQAIDGAEGSNSRLGFELNLGSPVVSSPVQVLYQLSGANGFVLEGGSADAVHTPEATYRPLVLHNTSSSGGYAYADFSAPLTTVSSSGEISAEAWVRRDAVTTAPGVLEFSDSSSHNQITLGFHGTTGKAKLEIRDPGGSLLVSLIADSEVGLNEWNHLAYSANALGVASLYVNGELAKRGQLAHVSGLKVALYEGKNFETLRSNSTETSINFTDSFDTAKGGNGDTFSIRATGQIQANSNGNNSFAVLSDDGVKVWVNGQQVVNNWKDHSSTWNSFTVPNLEAGEWYDIQIDYYENGGSARLQLADLPGGTPITALRHVPIYNTARSLNSIGRSAVASSGSGYLAGAVRGVGIWNAARNQDQIQASMLAANPSGSGLISALALNNSTANSVAGAPAVVLRSGSSNSASFASTPIYGITVPVGASSVSLPVVPIDDLTAEGTETLTLTLIDTGRYSIGGSSGTATASLFDNDTADVLFLSSGQTGNADSNTTWIPTSQFRVSEEDPGQGTSKAVGVRLNSRPAASVKLTLDPSSYGTDELKVTNPANASATAVELVFTPDNWDQVQQLQLQGVDDPNDDGDIAQSLRFTVTSSDAVYAALKPSVSVLTVDDDATTANSNLATNQSSSAPLANLTGPSQSTIHEAGTDSATFKISLPSAASEDTLIFLEMDPRLSKVIASDISVQAGSGSQSMAGLTRFGSVSGASETSALDSDGINENASTFRANQLTGNFTSTWSGYIYIPETGSYNFSVPVVGGVKLSLDGQVVIDKLNSNSKATWGTGTLQLNRGDFVAVTLDYQSFNNSAPSVALRWQRPVDSGTKTLDELVPSESFSRTDGFSLLIPKGGTSGTLSVMGVQDQLDEENESLTTALLAARGVEVLVKGQSGTSQLQVSLGTTDRVSITLAAGTVLSLGQALGSSAGQSDAIATFTLSGAATIHRDRTTNLAGSLAWTSYGQSSGLSSSVVGLVAGYGNDFYQVSDPSVSLTLTSPLSASGSGYLASLRLEPTNHSSVTLAGGTTLTYALATGEFVSLVLSNSLTLTSGQTLNNIAVTVPRHSSSLAPSSPALTGLSSSYVLPNTNVVQLIDDDQAGLRFSLDAAGNQPIDSTRVSLTEQGSSVTRYVRLTSQPTDSVTVYVETDDRSEVVLQVPSSNPAPAGSRIALTFTPGNWQTTQAFRVIPVDDKLVDGTIKVNLHARTTSADRFYAINENNLPKLAFEVKDNDSASLRVELQQTSISRAGNGFVNLSLTAEPTADVTVTLVPSDSQFTINNRSIGRGETLIFTPNNWATIQTVGLWAVDDNTVEDVTTSQLQLSSSSSDSRFNALNISPVQIDIVDNDLPQALITLISDSTEEAKPGRFQIQLSHPAPSSAGSKGLQVNYQISALSLDPGLGYPANPSSINKITQSPGGTTGQVRIAPGQSSSDVIVVPIDDFVADTVNKTFTVQLTSGDGYALSNDSASNSATVQIINNDVAGVVLFTSGERVLVKESGDSATYQLALLSQPTANVTVTITEQIPNGGSRQLGSSSTAYSQTLTFTPSNWYTAQQVSVRAYDDGLIEDGSGENQFTGIHASQLKYSFSSSDAAYNSTNHSGDSSHFTNMVQAVDVLDYELSSQTADALHSSLTSLQEGIDSLSLPIVGSLDGKTGGGLRKFITNLVNSVRQIGTPTPKKLSKLLSEEIAGALGIPESAVTVSLSMQGTSAVMVSFRFADSYDVFSIPLAADFGLPGLGFQSEGTLDAYFDYDAGLELIFPRSGDVYLNTATDKTYLNAEFNTSLSDEFKLTGGLGFLQLDAINQASVNENVEIGGRPASTELDVAFDLNLRGGAGSDGKLSFSELINSGLDLEEVFQYELQGNAAMSFGVTTSVNGSAAIPSFSFDLSSLLPLFDYSNTEETKQSKNATTFYFDNISLDLGSYITQMLSPIVDGLDSILNPLYPIVDALYSDTQIFASIGIEDTFDIDADGHVTPLNLASWFAGFYAEFDPTRGTELKQAVDSTIEFLNVIKGVMDLIRDLEKMSEAGDFYIDFGSYELATFNAGDASKETAKVDVDKTVGDLPDTEAQADAGGSNSSGKGSNTFKDIMRQLDELGFKIPLIDDPKNAIKLLLGQDVSLFEWRMPDMGMSSEIEEGFPIYPGIEGIIEGGFGVDATIGFGFDTYGLNEWMKSGFKASEAWKVFDGFYVADWLNGVDVPEFSMDATMGAGLGLSALVVRADITGGLEAAASFDLLDEGEIAGTSDGKIRGSEISDRISNPLDLFELVGSLSAYLQANVQVGLDMGFYSIWDTVWKESLAEIPLFEFGVGGSYGSGTVSNGYLQGTTVFWDSNANLTIDSYEPFTTSSDDAHYNLRIDHRTFDTNRNGTIDPSEGRLVAFGGIDSSTGLPLEVPFLAPLGQMLTPLTTLHTLAIDSGLSEVDASNWIDQAFALRGFDYLRDDPVLRLNQATGATATVSAWDAMAAYIGHIKLHFAWDVLTYSLKQMLSEQYPEDLHTELGLITAFTQELLELSADTPINDRLATAALRIISRHQPDLPSDISILAQLAGRMAAKANWEISREIDTVLASAKASQINLPEAYSTINQLKQSSFNHFRSAAESLSHELHLIDDPAKLISTVQKRLEIVHSGRPTLNAAPTALTLANFISSLAENTSTASRIKVADIVISDDALGTNIISLAGADAGSFEVIGTELFLKAGTALDFEAKSAYAVTVSASDPSLSASTPVAAAFNLAVTDVNERPGTPTVATVVPVPVGNGEVKQITVNISNADLVAGSNLAVITNLGINASGLTTLAELGVTSNSSGLDFQLAVDQGARASLNAVLDLVAADLVPVLADPITGIRRTDRKLLYYAVDTLGAITPLTYDPITGAGARFYDLDNDGTADFFSLSLIDGGYGDKDGLINGIIDDPSFAGFTDLTNLRFSTAGSGTLTISDPTNAAPAAVHLRASLTARPDSANQIGYVVLNASEVASADSLLSDLNWLRGRARTLFSTLENNDVTLPGGISFDRDIQLINGQSIRFFEVVDASLDQLTSLADSRFRFLTAGEISNAQAGFSSSSGVRFGLSLLPGDPGLNALISNAQELAPVLDLSAFTTAQSISGTLVLGREADFNATAGFYRSLDAAGTVLAADGITRLNPGDSGYAAAALRNDNLIAPLTNLSVADNQTASRSFSAISGGSFLAPFAQVNGNTFFAYGAANSDGLSHFRSLGNNFFGLEDMLGGGDLDFDDLVIGFNFTTLV